MKIRIIKNVPESTSCNDISKYIGQIFEARFQTSTKENIMVDFKDGCGMSTVVYKGEYEIINDINKELLIFVSKNCPEDVYYQDILDFILKHKVVLVDLLQ